MGLLISKSNFDWVPVHLAKPMKRFFVQDGNILLNITGAGSIGRVSIYYGNEQPLTNQHIARLDIKKAYDSAYICAFLSSWWGERIIEQGISGSTGQLNLVNDHIHTLPVLIPDTKVQIYIGDKVWQAGRLSDRSRYWEKRIKILVTSAEIKKSLDVKKQKWNTPIVKDLEPRLDAKYYNHQAMQVLKICQVDSQSIRELLPDASNGFEYRHFVEQGRPYITVTEVSSERLNIIDAPQIPLSVSIPEKAKVDRCCVLVIRTGSVGTAIKVHSEDEDASISSHLIRLKFKEEIIAAAVAAFLNSEAGCCLLHKISYGAVQPQVGQEEVLSLPIPSFILNCASDILHCMNLQEKCIRSAERLTNAAKLLVEALIEGKISETDLKAAQEGLEKGDTTLDREILARLTRKGMDNPNEPPLFPDLDALYAALASLEATETTEAANPPQNRVANVYHLHSTPLALASEAHDTAYRVSAEVPE